ncbi:endonuclease V [Pseudenhygromyxa sp. WMMC2535]|uniref:endonuclease V n=1 Tax=Pseudenhygromyxa sp. WMMC2535 TaxID=2712867 RepID=UPI0015559F32|nr:endonuclease V [Pseudenhygromyxa sp. WMMC2535]NVB39287.1 endonuclease V [Pseudenhygromyxa sp. WMMC2535]
MIVCVDVDYRDRPQGKTAAVAAGVVLPDFSAPQAALERVCHIPEVADYVPGRFYERELPCVLALLDTIALPLETVVVDGYVILDAAGRYGLGGHLYEVLGRELPVIGVAKNPFRDNPPAIEVCRGESRRPLFVTALGVDPRAAAEQIERMHGRFRLPTMLKRVDRLCRES